MERIDGDARNCAGCDFKKKRYETDFCDQIQKEITYIELCPTGPMVHLPDRGSEMHEFMGKVELKWRREGQRHLEKLQAELAKRKPVEGDTQIM